MAKYKEGRALAELGTTVGLPKGPPSWGSIVGHHCAAITGSDLEREALAIEVGVALPVLAPISGHCLPTSPGPFDWNRVHITGTTNVCDEDQVEVGVPIDGESETSPSPARYPTKIKTQKKISTSSTTNLF